MITTIETPIYWSLRNKYLDALEKLANARKALKKMSYILAVQKERIKTLKEVIEVKDEQIRICESQIRD